MPAQLHNITDRFNGINCLEPIPPWRLVKLAMENGKLGFKLCGPTDVPCGISGVRAGTVGATNKPDDFTVYNLRACAEWKVEFATDADAFAPIYVGAEGMVTKTQVAGAMYLGRARKAMKGPRTENGQTVRDLGDILQDMGTGKIFAT